MRTRCLVVVIAVVAMATACGGDDGGGPGGDTKLVELGATELEQLCDELATTINGPRTVTCSDGTIMIDDHAAEQAECIDDYGALPDTCDATVADARGCADAFASDACNATADGDCLAIFQCALR